MSPRPKQLFDTVVAFAATCIIHYTSTASPGGFTNVAHQSGLNYIQYSADPTGVQNEQITTGGAAAGDYDNDGWIDLFVTRLDGTDILFRNLGGEQTGLPNIKFQNVTAEAGFSLNLPSNGAAWGDIDNDGDLDLYVSTVDSPRFYLYLNNGDGTFTEDATARGADLASSTLHKGNSVSFGDYDRDGYLDLHTNEWGIDRDAPTIGNHSVLLHNQGFAAPGHFENVTLVAGVELGTKDRQYAFTSNFSDLDNDGWPDLAVNGDFFTSQLFWNNGDGTFTESENANINLATNSMGSAFGDVNKDGFIDWYTTSIHDNRLYLNNGDRTFTDVGENKNINDAEWAWGTAFLDIENDGDLDIIATNGWYFPDFPPEGNTYYSVDQMVLFRNDDGIYNDVSDEYGIVDKREGKGLLKFDYDNDGDLDIFVANNRAGPALYRNDIESGNAWLRVKLNGDTSNRNGIGAKVWLKATADSNEHLEEITGSSHFLGQSESVAHFGLGPHNGTLAELKVEWPSGIVQTLNNIQPNQVLLLDEPKNTSLVEPTIDTQPVAGHISKDSKLVLSIAASGNPIPVINWYKDGLKIEGATGPNYTIKKIKPYHAGTYTAQAINSQGSQFSDPVELSIDWDVDQYSIARAWNEALLDAIRLDLPKPVVHARNLFHVSAAMWDAWSAYDKTGKAVPYFVDERGAPTTQAEFSRREAISYAAYRILVHRYKNAVGGENAVNEFEYLMRTLGYDKDNETIIGYTAAAVGNRIAAGIIEFGQTDGSNEANDYADQTGYTPVNDPLIFKLPGTELADPNRWQPLSFDFRISQNGISIAELTQKFVGVNWGLVTPFALSREADSDVYRDPGPPPLLGTETDTLYRQSAIEIIRYSSLLDPNNSTLKDISPNGLFNNSLGANDGIGRQINPFTNQPYPEQLVKHADWGRVIAEFWADGPDSETPPGHWNTLANYVSYHPQIEKRINGVGPLVSDLEWDVKLYFAINGSLHDAAIAAWDAKAKYDYVRPVSMIRYLCGNGQASDPSLPSYHEEGILLVPGLVELITEESAAYGERHAHLSNHIGEIAVNAWRGEPTDPFDRVSGVGWIRGIEWMPYQRLSFVTPPFAAYISGHSTFSRAAAEVLTLFTGSPFFPGGLGEWSAAKNDFLVFETGPSEEIVLQWATYYDSADEAGLSRLYGGIHIAADDFNGRIIGSEVGVSAFLEAQHYFSDPDLRGNALANVSSRGYTGQGEDVMIAGFVLEDCESKDILVRGIGPGLEQFGVAQRLDDPSITLFSESAMLPQAHNTDWSQSSNVEQISKSIHNVGAFSIDNASKDAALLEPLGEGAFTIHVNADSSNPGICVAEIYDAALSEKGSLVNLSSRAKIGTGEQVLIGGFVVSGTEPIMALIRGVGPSLDRFDIDSPLADPNLNLYKLDPTTETYHLIASNDDWNASDINSAIANIGMELGAFNLYTHSKDAAILVALEPGIYSAIVSGENSENDGIGLVEIYLVK